jgi:hypothetical protein
VKLKYILAAYSAAGLSFVASLFRDYVIINFTNQSKEFFEYLYVVSMAAGFGVNAIALGSGVLGRAALTIFYTIGVIIIFLILPEGYKSTNLMLLLSLILLLWLVGAQSSRSLVELGWVFLGRVREAIASISLAIMIFTGFGMQSSFLAAVASGTIFSLAMLKKSSNCRLLTESNEMMKGLTKLLWSVILANIATFLITYWALVQTSKHGEIFGLDISTAVRFSMYFYQSMIIGSVLLVSRHSKVKFRINLGPLSVVMALLLIASLYLSINLSLVIIPILSAVAHYLAVLHLQGRYQLN